METMRRRKHNAFVIKTARFVGWGFRPPASTPNCSRDVAPVYTPGQAGLDWPQKFTKCKTPTSQTANLKNNFQFSTEREK